MCKVVLLGLLPFLLAYAAVSDVMTMTIPNRLTLALVASFPIVVACGGLALEQAALHVAAGLVVLAATFAMFALGWIGGGDAKLAAAVGLWLGFDSLLDYLVVAAIGGGALTLAILLLRSRPLPAFTLGWRWLCRLADPREGVPYGVALAGAALLVLPQSSVWFGALAV